MSKPKHGINTIALHVGQEPDTHAGATVPPIYMTSTFTQEGLGKHKGFEYSRVNNPTRDALERCIAALEGGTHCVAFATGLAAVTAVLQNLRPGDQVLAGKDLYGGTWRVLEMVFKPWGLEVLYAEGDTAEHYEIAAKKATNLKMIWAESPTNPLLQVLDLPRIAKLRDSIPGCRMVVDNTFATPYLQKPFEFGADLIIHSLTKYLGGHSDILGGAVVAKSKELIDPILFYLKSAGAVPAPMECWLVQRGIKTLGVRMERHCSNALWLAQQLEAKGVFAKVYYPGLDSHPHQQLAKAQMPKGYGGMITVEMNQKEEVAGFVSRLKLFSLAEGLGGVESLVGYPAMMSHGSLTPEARHAKGISDEMVRFSVGIEDKEDLLEDILQALT
ncbi:MAG: trans-sulfuration enzyme family protein [Sumerlaeia bacterium]